MYFFNELLLDIVWKSLSLSNTIDLSYRAPKKLCWGISQLFCCPDKKVLQNDELFSGVLISGFLVTTEARTTCVAKENIEPGVDGLISRCFSWKVSEVLQSTGSVTHVIT